MENVNELRTLCKEFEEKYGQVKTTGEKEIVEDCKDTITKVQKFMARMRAYVTEYGKSLRKTKRGSRLLKDASSSVVFLDSKTEKDNIVLDIGTTLKEEAGTSVEIPMETPTEFPERSTPVRPDTQRQPVIPVEPGVKPSEPTIPIPVPGSKSEETEPESETSIPDEKNNDKPQKAVPLSEFTLL